MLDDIFAEKLCWKENEGEGEGGGIEKEVRMVHALDQLVDEAW